MYNDNLEMYSSNGVVVVFPFVKSPDDDKHFWVTNTDGKYLIKAIEYAKAMNQDKLSPFFDLIDIENIIIAVWLNVLLIYIVLKYNMYFVKI